MGLKGSSPGCGEEGGLATIFGGIYTNEKHGLARLKGMPSAKRADVDDYFDQLSDSARSHLEKLRAISCAADPGLVETLHWNHPAYLKDGVRLWMLQSFKAHCSLRFPTHQFGPPRAEVEAAGYESGEGFIKLPYDKPLPVELLERLVGYRLEEFSATGSAWSAG